MMCFRRVLIASLLIACATTAQEANAMNRANAAGLLLGASVLGVGIGIAHCCQSPESFMGEAQKIIYKAEMDLASNPNKEACLALIKDFEKALGLILKAFNASKDKRSFSAKNINLAGKVAEYLEKLDKKVLGFKDEEQDEFIEYPYCDQ